jgi:hypothetical protein
MQRVGYAARDCHSGWLMRCVCYDLDLIRVEVVVCNGQGSRIQRGWYVVFRLDVCGHVG